VGTSAFMGSFTAWTFTGAAGMAYESGYSVMFLFLGSSLGYFMNFLFLAPWLRQMRVTTLPEAIALRFGEKTRNFYALYEVPVRILYAAMSLYSLGIFCSAVFGYDINYVIIGCGIVVLFYSATGGRWAVMATDFLQALILLPLTVIIAYICLDKIGGIRNLLQAIEAEGLTSMLHPVISPSKTGAKHEKQLYSLVCFYFLVVQFGFYHLSQHAFFFTSKSWLWTLVSPPKPVTPLRVLV